MYKLFKHKKGIAIDDVLPLIFTIVVCIFIIILLNTCNVKKKKEVDANIQIRLDMIKAEQKLSDFLEKKVEVDKKNITMTDLINLYYYNGAYKYRLAEETENMLNSLPKPALGVSGWNLNIYIMPEEEKLIGIDTYRVVGWFGKGSIFTYIPLSNDEGRYLKLELGLECQC